MAKDITNSYSWRGMPSPDLISKLFRIARDWGYKTLNEAGKLEYFDGHSGWTNVGELSEERVLIKAFNPKTEYRFVFNPKKEIKMPTQQAKDLGGLQREQNPVDRIVESLSDVNAVLNERGSRYGKFKDHADITQTLKQSADHFLKVKHNTDLKNKLTAYQHEALDMIFHKIGRILNGDPNYVDSWVDIAGYAQLVVDELEGRGR